MRSRRLSGVLAILTLAIGLGGAGTTPATATTSTYAPGTTVSSNVSHQVVVASVRPGHITGTIARYQWTGTAWVRVGYSSASFGINGEKPANRRLDGDHTTPLGTFFFAYEFGQGTPGTKMPYRKVTNCSWWIEATSQSDYNRWRESCAVRGSVATSSEHLRSYITNNIGQYRQAAVIGFNYLHPIRRGYGSGSGIFLHYSPLGRPTWGCVGVNNYSELVNTLRWLDPRQTPRIVIRTV